MSRTQWNQGRATFVALAGLLLSACVVAEPGPGAGPGGPPPRPDRPQACTFEYAPVCAQRGREERTFSNACMARAEGFRVIDRGECRSVGPGPGAGVGPGRPGRPSVCTREYAPVCATRGRQTQTFANACMAQAEGFRIVATGECRPTRPRS